MVSSGADGFFRQKPALLVMDSMGRVIFHLLRYISLFFPHKCFYLSVKSISSVYIHC